MTTLTHKITFQTVSYLLSSLFWLFFFVGATKAFLHEGWPNYVIATSVIFALWFGAELIKRKLTRDDAL